MIQKPFDQITKTDIDELVSNAVSESRTIEFKLALSRNSDQDKKEFLADVSSFSNASGGDLIYGISATNGIATSVPGLSITNPDAEILTLEGRLQSSIDPRIPGLQIKKIDGFANGPAIIIRIPQSWASPHMVTFKGTSRFFTRNSAGKYQMDVGEIRASFALSESVPERIRNFRIDRIGKIIADDTPLPLLPGGRIVLHVLPVESFTQPPSLDMRTLANEHRKLPPLYPGGWSKRMNLDGLFTFDKSSDGHCLGYAQLFRTGAIETVDCVLLDPEEDGSRTIPTIAYEKELLKSLSNMLEFQKELGFTPPIFVLVSMTGVENYSMTVRNSRLRSGEDLNRVDRDTLLLPDVVVEDYDEKVDTVLRPVFDAVWQSAGFSCSQNYDENGNWIDK